MPDDDINDQVTTQDLLALLNGVLLYALDHDDYVKEVVGTAPDADGRNDSAQVENLLEVENYNPLVPVHTGTPFGITPNTFCEDLFVDVTNKQKELTDAILKPPHRPIFVFGPEGFGKTSFITVTLLRILKELGNLAMRIDLKAPPKY